MVSPYPYEVSQDQDSFTIIWDDKHRSVYPCRYLRTQCPCALCAEKRNPARKKPEIPGEGAPVMIMEAKQVGQYALRFSFSDMHGTGIYTFQYLRDLCPCDDCLEKK